MRLSAKAPIVIRGEEITHLDADGYKHLPRATSLPDGKVLATSGGKWAPSDLSGISVSSVFGRTGAVVAQTGDYTAAQVGAEPYAGTPAQTSFWRSTAAGVRAWVQLVAADITDLAATLAGYLTKANPTFTGTLTGPRATLTEFGKLQGLPGIPEYGALYGSGVNPTTTNYALRVADDGSDTLINGAAHVAIAIGGLSKVGVYADQLSLAPGVALKMSTITVIDASRNITGATLKGGNLAGTGNRPLVAGADGTIDDQDAATFRGTIGAMAAADPVFTGALKQGGTTRIASGGGADFASLRVSNLASAFNGVLTSDYVGGVGVRGATDFRDNYIQAADANHHHDTQYAPLAGAEILIHSDFGRSATTDVWQSAFTDNTASGLQFAANTIANGTKLIIEQALSIPGDGGGAAYQVYIGPQLTGEQAPAGSTYAIAISPNIAGQNGTGTLRIEIELLGSGSSITGYVTSTFAASGSNAPWVNTGMIAVNGTQANSLDVRFNPDSVTSYIIRRNRVRRVNP